MYIIEYDFVFLLRIVELQLYKITLFLKLVLWKAESNMHSK